jgi:hypothetical protein
MSFIRPFEYRKAWKGQQSPLREAAPTTCPEALMAAALLVVPPSVPRSTSLYCGVRELPESVLAAVAAADAPPSASTSRAATSALAAALR